MNRPRGCLEDLDKMCLGYGLSLFDSVENAIKRYRNLYDRKRPREKEKFKEEKGTDVVQLRLTKEDGLADKSSANGHFTLHEYERVDLRKSVLAKTSIFKENGEFNL
jgi:hypothetical protein